MLDYWLRLRQHRLETAAAFWPALLLASPGLLAATYVYPVLLSTVGGMDLFWHGAGAGAGLGAGLAFSVRGAFREARAEWSGFVLCLLLVGGAAAIHLNAEQPGAERRFVASRVLEVRPGDRRHSEQAVRRLGLRSVVVEWQGHPERIVVDSELMGPRDYDGVLLLSVYEGRFGFPVIEGARRADASVR